MVLGLVCKILCKSKLASLDRKKRKHGLTDAEMGRQTHKVTRSLLLLLIEYNNYNVPSSFDTVDIKG